MAAYYVYSGAGGAGTGADWANAYTTVTAAIARPIAAGDTLYIADDHAESTAGAVTLAFTGTQAAPNYMLCVLRTGGSVPPVSADLRTTGSIATTGANNITVTGHVYVYGCIFSAGDAAAQGRILMSTAASVQMYESCSFFFPSTSTGNLHDLGGLGQKDIMFKNCSWRCAVALTTGIIRMNGNNVRIQGGSYLTSGGGVSPTIFFSIAAGNSRPNFLSVDGFDFSSCSSSMSLVQGGAINDGGFVVLRNSKLPASWTGPLVSAQITVPNARVEMYNCDSTDTNYRIWIEDYIGNQRQQTGTRIRTGGATDGTTPFSWMIQTYANAEFPMLDFVTTPLFYWATTTGSAVTLTVDVIIDSLTALTNKDIWLNVQYLGTSGFPLSLNASDACADVLATAVDQATSTATWDTTGFSTAGTKQNLSVTFTPQEVGCYIATVIVAKPNIATATLYVDPVLQVS